MRIFTIILITYLSVNIINSVLVAAEDNHVARAKVILDLQLPNKLKVGGREFKTKDNPIGKGVFVYDPRTRFYGVERYLIWYVINDKVYPLNGPSKMLTPNNKFPREDGIQVPSTHDAISYVFRGEPLKNKPSNKTSKPLSTKTYTVKEYNIYRSVIDTPMSISEEQAYINIATTYGLAPEDVKKITRKVNDIIIRNKWIGSKESEIRHASDYK